MRTVHPARGTAMLLLAAGLFLLDAPARAAASDAAFTAPIVDAQGQPVRSSIATLEPVLLGGTKQWLLVRGHDIWNPILLVLDSGPGVSHMAWHRRYLGDLERHFIVVNWDQRGAGKSYAPGQNASHLQIGRYVDDTIALAAQLADRFRQEKVYVLAHGFGAIVATLAAQKQPDTFHALVNVAPLVNPAASEQLSYRYAIDVATELGDAPTVEALEALAPPPWPAKDAPARLAAAQAAALRFAAAAYPSNAFREDALGAVQAATEYTAAEKQRWAKARVETFAAVYPQLARIDLARQVPALSVPVYFVMGRFDYTTCGSVAGRYFESLSAPRKLFTWFERSGAAPQFEEPVRLTELLVGTVLPETRRRQLTE